MSFFSQYSGSLETIPNSELLAELDTSEDGKLGAIRFPIDKKGWPIVAKCSSMERGICEVCYLRGLASRYTFSSSVVSFQL